MLSRIPKDASGRREGWRRAFSTLGCAGTPLEAVLRLARLGGWEGVELRAADGEPVNVGLSQRERAEVRCALVAARVAPLSIASYVDVDDPERADDAVVDDVLRHVRLAADIGAPFVRCFPGGPSGDGAAARRLAAVARELDPFPGVAVALETHDSCARGRDARDVVDQVGDPRIRVIWDIQHPWRAGEPLAETLRALQPVLAYVQITDARSLEDPTPAPFGTGVLPLREARSLLSDAGYAGWISLEWASYWYPEAPPLEHALRSAQLWFNGSLWDTPSLAGPGPG
jgi:sugar phosphate isomerase/epimerase